MTQPPRTFAKPFSSHLALALATLLSMALLFTTPAIAQGGEGASGEVELRREIETLKAGQAEIRRQLIEIKNLLEKQAAKPLPTKPGLPDVELDLSDAPALGQDDAPITVVEFSDFQCPFCARHVKETLPELEKTLISDGKIRYVASDFPLPNHPQAFPASVAAHCAGEQGKFWDAAKIFFDNFRELGEEKIKEYAQTIELDMEPFEECLDSGRYDEKIRQAKDKATDAGVSATPTFLVGYTSPDGKFKAVEHIRGAHPFTRFESIVMRLLRDQEKAGKPDAPKPATN